MNIQTFQVLKTWQAYQKVLKNDWGSTIHIFDPDGNRVGIRDEEKFMAE